MHSNRSKVAVKLVTRTLRYCSAVLLAAFVPTLSGLVSMTYGDEGRPGSPPYSAFPLSSGPTLLAQASPARPSAASLQAELDALIKAARAEGEVSFYSGVPENALKRTADAFTAKYGIKVQFIRLPGAQVPSRYATEAEASKISADMLFHAGDSVSFVEDGIKKGWMEPVSAARLPAIRSGEFPSHLVTGPTAIVQIIPWLIAYNTDKVRGADIPKDWRDVLNPKFKGLVLLADPKSSDTYFVFFSVLLDKYGGSFLSQLRDQNPRWYGSGVPAMQALGAGEGVVEFPAIPAQVNFIKDKGAPLAMVKPDINTGIETHVILTARAKARHPNAARLMANWVMTVEGNKVFNDDVGGMSVYDTASLPKDYQRPKAPTKERIDLILKLLGQ